MLHHFLIPLSVCDDGALSRYFSVCGREVTFGSALTCC